MRRLGEQLQERYISDMRDRLLSMFESPARLFAESAGIDLPKMWTVEEATAMGQEIQMLIDVGENGAVKAKEDQFWGRFAIASKPLMEAIGRGEGNIDVFASLVSGVYAAISYTDFLALPPDIKVQLVSFVFGDYSKQMPKENG